MENDNEWKVIKGKEGTNTWALSYSPDKWTFVSGRFREDDQEMVYGHWESKYKRTARLLYKKLTDNSVMDGIVITLLIQKDSRNFWELAKILKLEYKGR